MSFIKNGKYHQSNKSAAINTDIQNSAKYKVIEHKKLFSDVKNAKDTPTIKHRGSKPNVKSFMI